VSRRVSVLTKALVATVGAALPVALVLSVLAASLDGGDPAQRRARVALLVGAAVVALGGLAAGLWLGARVVPPLRRLTREVERKAAGAAVEPAAERTGDEIARLETAFGRMVSDAAQRQEALDRGRREAETFVEIEADLAETLEVVTLLQKIARHARFLCRSDLVYIAPFDQRAGAARVVALLGERTAALHRLRIEPGRGIAGRVLTTRRPVRAAFDEEARLRDGLGDPAAAEDVATVLAVPMILEHEMIGLIYVANRTPVPFTEHDEAVLLRLAVPATLAVRNARLVSELAQERDLIAVRSRELARSEAQLRGIVQAASDGILTVDRRGRITSVNRAAERMFGYAAQDMLARDLERLVPAPVEAPEGAESPAPGPELGGEREGVRRDGSRFPVEMSVSVVRTEHDHFFAVVVRDITERKRAYETRLRLASIVESSDDAIIGWSTDLRVTSWNPGAERIYGYRAAEIIGQPFSVLVPPDRAAEVTDFVERLRRGDHIQSVETVRGTKDGRLLDVSLTISATRDEVGRVTGFSTIARDISESKAIERLKDEFIATVSHELRTPLTAISGHLELVLDGDAGAVTPLQRDFLGVAVQNTDRLRALIDDLLDVEKIEAGKMRIREEPLDLAAVLGGVVATFRVEAERKGLAFREAIADRLMVVGDRDRLIQVFANLVSNAIKYTARGEVGIQAERRDGHVAVTVHDTGAGISPEDRAQLFTKFFRSQDSVVRDAGGTGLGLVIAQAIVERHGGRVEVDSEKGVGSKFIVWLP
jgi:PAS domain S-box-containing protein